MAFPEILVRLIVILEAEVNLGFEMENEEFPIKSPAGETITTVIHNEFFPYLSNFVY